MPEQKTSPEKPKEQEPKKAQETLKKNNEAARALTQSSDRIKKPEKPKPEEPTKVKTEKKATKPTTEPKPEPAKPEKKEKNWRVVRGALSAQNNDGSAQTTTIGIGIENKKGTKQIIL